MVKLDESLSICLLRPFDIAISFFLVHLQRRLMAQVILCNIEDDVKAGLKTRATQHGWSIEKEVRQILRCAVSEVDQVRPALEEWAD